MARFYSSDKKSNPASADKATLSQETALKFHWTATDAARQVGGTRRMAEQILEMKGKEVNKKSLASEMRNVNRYIKKESGVAGEGRKPSPAAQKVINKIGSDDKLKKEGHKRPPSKIKKPGSKPAKGQTGGGGGGNSVHVSITGTTSVNGYEDDRDIDIYMNEDEMDRFIDNPSYETLSDIWGAEVFLIDGDINFDF